VTWEPRRRDRVDLSTPAERAIRAAREAVEQAGADPRLTDATNLLSAALTKVSDFVDGVPNSGIAASQDERSELARSRQVGGLGIHIHRNDDAHDTERPPRETQVVGADDVGSLDDLGIFPKSER
jgi:hypothetical protein